MRKLTFYAHDHHGKGKRYIEALHPAFERIERSDLAPYPKVDFVLADNDVRGRRHLLAKLRYAGAKAFFIYPHTGRPNVVNDLRQTWEHTTAHFVPANSHVEIMQRYGYPKPIHAVGWSLCPLRQFTPRPQARSVLFAPIHHRCAEIDKQVNRAAFNKLYALAEAGEIELTVRYLWKLFDGSGIAAIEHPNVTYTQGELTPAWEQIDSADVVVAHQTFAYLAVARGVPCVMMAEDMPTHLCPFGREPLFVPHWDDYADLLAFPLDIMHTDDPLALLKQAARSDDDIAEWRGRMIGEPFDAVRYVEIIKSYL